MPFEDRYAQAHEACYPLSDAETVAFGRVLGRLEDEELASGTGLLVQAVKARSAKLCPADALYLVGRDRDLERYPGETDAAYRARLEAAFDAHEWAGTAKGIEDQLTAALTAMGAAAPVVTVLEQWQGAYAGADWYSLISVVIQEGPWVRVVLGNGGSPDDFVLGTSVLGGTSVTPEDIALMKRVTRKWKDCGAYPARIKASSGIDVLGLGFTLGTSLLRAAPDKDQAGYATEWIMGRRLGVDWYIGAKLGAFEI